MTAYYNEWEPYPAQWLRNLIAANLIAAGDVDERSIKDVKADDLKKYTQCHFFAGIGGWSYALRLAGWDDEKPVWTGSCPCQSLSVAGQRKGHLDERHLWPAFYTLIAECRPSIVFGEQVASKDGREWLAGVRADLEDTGYAVGGADLCAAGVGAPHIRQRLYWMAHAHGSQQYRGAEASWQQQVHIGMHNGDEGLGDPATKRLQEQRREYRPSGERCGGLLGFAMQAGVPQWNGPTVALECADGYRRASAEPNAFPVAHGVLKRMGKLRGSGNAIVPQVAQAFIEAFMECMP